jgi:hypothetical protein
VLVVVVVLLVMAGRERTVGIDLVREMDVDRVVGLGDVMLTSC